MGAVLLVLSLAPLPAQAVDVEGDDAADAYSGVGGLILPSGIDPEVRNTVAHCSGCGWKLTGPCIHLPDEGAQVACMTVITGCPVGQVRLRAWFRAGADTTWRDVGLVCVGSSGATTVDDVGQALLADFRRVLPAVTVHTQPRSGILPHLPVAFDSGQPQHLGASRHEVLGHEVHLRPSATYLWAFGDGQRMTTTQSGSRYPDLTVSHAYRRGGLLTVRVTVVWRATFSVDGLGPFEVAEPIHQEATVQIAVGQARAVLVR